MNFIFFIGAFVAMGSLLGSFMQGNFFGLGVLCFVCICVLVKNRITKMRVPSSHERFQRIKRRKTYRLLPDVPVEKNKKKAPPLQQQQRVHSPSDDEENNQ